MVLERGDETSVGELEQLGSQDYVPSRHIPQSLYRLANMGRGFNVHGRHTLAL
jgi:hypothetical protein